MSKFFLFAIAVFVQIASATKCADVLVMADYVADHLNFGYTMVAKYEEELDDFERYHDEYATFSWSKSSNQIKLDSITYKRVGKTKDSEPTEEFETFVSDARSYSIYTDEKSGGSTIQYSRGKPYMEESVEVVGDSIKIKQLLVSSDRVMFTDWYERNDTLFQSYNTYSGYSKDSVFYQRIESYYFVDDPENENHCLSYRWDDDDKIWVANSRREWFEVRGDTIVSMERYDYGKGFYEMHHYFFVKNSALFGGEDEDPLRVNKLQVPALQSPARQKHYDLKGRRFIKENRPQPYRVLF